MTVLHGADGDDGVDRADGRDRVDNEDDGAANNFPSEYALVSDHLLLFDYGNPGENMPRFE